MPDQILGCWAEQLLSESVHTSSETRSGACWLYAATALHVTRDVHVQITFHAAISRAAIRELSIKIAPDRDVTTPCIFTRSQILRSHSQTFRP